MTLLEFATNIKNKISARLTEINAALENKGQTACADISEVPAKIEAITTKTNMSDANATGAQLLKGYRAYNDGGPFDGDIPVLETTSANSTATNDGGVKFTFPAGYYKNEHSGEITKAGDVGLTVTVDKNGKVTAKGTHSTSGYVKSTDQISGTASLTVETWMIYYVEGTYDTKTVVVI